MKDDISIEKTRLIECGKTSYLNSILQCLIDIDGLGKFFLNEEISQDILTSLRKGKQKRLSFAIQRLFFHAILEKDKTYKPQSILGVLKEKNFIF